MTLRQVFTLAGAAAVTAATALAYPSGYTGGTLKTTVNGCGGCHGSSRNTAVTVSITGRNTVTAGDTATFTVTVAGASGSQGGIDISARRGTLAAVSATLQLVSGELTHRARVAVPSTYLVRYTAPATGGTDTLYATGKDNNDRWNWAPNFGITVAPATAVREREGRPEEAVLDQNYPNPFNPATVIGFSVQRAARVRLSVHDLVGNEVALLVDGTVSAGSHTARFEAGGRAAGVYFSRLTVGGGVQVRKMLLVK
jgi:hypothetical protein